MLYAGMLDLVTGKEDRLPVAGRTLHLHMELHPVPVALQVIALRAGDIMDCPPIPVEVLGRHLHGSVLDGTALSGSQSEALASAPSLSGAPWGRFGSKLCQRVFDSVTHFRTPGGCHHKLP